MDVYSTISSLFSPGASGMPVHPFSLCYSCPAEQVTDRSLGTRLKKRQNLMKSMLLKKTSNNNKLNYKNRTKTKQKQNKTKTRKNGCLFCIRIPSCYKYSSVFLQISGAHNQERTTFLQSCNGRWPVYFKNDLGANLEYLSGPTNQSAKKQNYWFGIFVLLITFSFSLSHPIFKIAHKRSGTSIFGGKSALKPIYKYSSPWHRRSMGVARSRLRGSWNVHYGRLPFTSAMHTAKNLVHKHLNIYFLGVFNKTIIPLALVGYHMIIANSVLPAALAK